MTVPKENIPKKILYKGVYKMKRKSIIAVGMAALMSLALLAGCGSSTEPQSVSTNGSTSMEKVIGALSEKFMETNKDITVTYDPTGSGG